MCTALNEKTPYHLFGRTLDLECSYGEEVVITPRRFRFEFKHESVTDIRYAIIGTAHIAGNTPLYYDAANEKGLCAAALRFPELTVYRTPLPDRINLASFEIIPWILGNFSSAAEARAALERVNITNDDFSIDLPSTPLHWMIADKENTFVVESVADGVKIYDNPTGVLTNAPEFSEQTSLLKKSESDKLLGDGSSTSRFIRANYAKSHTMPESDKTLAISRFFHIMSTVSLPHGYSRGIGDKPMKTLYTSCIDTEDMTYYFTTYSCRQIRGVRLTEQIAGHTHLTSFPTNHSEKICFLS